MPSFLPRTLLFGFAMATMGLALLSPAPNTAAASRAVLGSSFSFNWTGTPAAPLPWSPGLINDWDLIVHNRDNQNSLQAVNAMHGADCSPFPATHAVTAFQDAVFICNNHMMTALNGGGYSEIVMTPSRMLDFSSLGTLQISASTAKLDNRDWIDFWISPFAENLLLPSGGVPPDLQGPTADALSIVEESVPTTARLQEFIHCGSVSSCVEHDYAGTGRSVEDCVAPLGGVSASRRDARLLTLSPNHVTYALLVNGVPCTLLDTDFAPLGFTTGVVQVGHHSYSPDEGTACNLPGCTVNRGAGAGNTWHWSNFSLSPAVPFTMLRGNVPLTGVQATTTATVLFAGAAPPNSFLRFSGLARRGSIQISANGGAFFPAKEQIQKGDGSDGVNDASHIGYWTPIPAGTTAVTFAAQSSTQPWTISDVSIWSSDRTSITPIAVAPAGGGAGSGGTTGGSSGGTGGGAGPTIGSSGGAGAEGGMGQANDGALESGGGTGSSGNPLENENGAPTDNQTPQKSEPESAGQSSTTQESQTDQVTPAEATATIVVGPLAARVVRSPALLELWAVGLVLVAVGMFAFLVRRRPQRRRSRRS